jgi:signal transduction histidine kinase
MWNEKSASLTIIVHPPWWGTWWFKTSCVLGIISLIIGFYLFRTEQLRKQKYTLQQEVKQRTTDLKMKNKLLEENTNYLNDSNALLLERQQKITEQRNQLEELNSMKDRLLSVIAHDLTSPFNTVLGFSEILQNEIDDLEHEEIQVMAGTIYESSRRVYGLLENLLNWARSQMHEIKFEPISVDLEKLIREIIEIYWFQIQKKKIHLSITNHAEHNPFADKNMLKAILRNLLSNAVKYTQKYGSISIRIDERGGNKIVISISDSGQGMDQYTIKHLFDLKESASKDGTEGEKGSGFGLILTQDFIHKNGGKLKVKSELGEGSSFIFDLPINV